MSPFIPNGIYTIRNGEFFELVAGLTGGMMYSLIIASEGGKPTDQQWKITNHGSSGNQVTIENVTHPGSFANVPIEEVNAPLVGSKKDRLWTLVKVDWGKFMIQTEDGQYVWELPDGIVGTTIVLRHSGKDNQKWTFGG